MARCQEHWDGHFLCTVFWCYSPGSTEECIEVHWTEGRKEFAQGSQITSARASLKLSPESPLRGPCPSSAQSDDIRCEGWRRVPAHRRHQKYKLTICCALSLRPGFSHFSESMTSHSPARERRQLWRAAPTHSSPTHFPTPAVGYLCSQVASWDLPCAGSASSLFCCKVHYKLSPLFLGRFMGAHALRGAECILFTSSPLACRWWRAKTLPQGSHWLTYTASCSSHRGNGIHSTSAQQFLFHVAETVPLFLSLNCRTFYRVERQQRSRCQGSVFPRRTECFENSCTLFIMKYFWSS